MSFKFMHNYISTATQNVPTLSDIMKKAGYVYLDDLSSEWWSKLENTDSWRIESMEEAELLASLRDEDLQLTMNLIASGKSVPAPIILFNFDVNPHLVTGNAQLMIAKAMGVPASAFFINMASDKQNETLNMPVTGYRDREGPVPAR